MGISQSPKIIRFPYINTNQKSRDNSRHRHSSNSSRRRSDKSFRSDFYHRSQHGGGGQHRVASVCDLLIGFISLSIFVENDIKFMGQGREMKNYKLVLISVSAQITKSECDYLINHEVYGNQRQWISIIQRIDFKISY